MNTNTPDEALVAEVVRRVVDSMDSGKARPSSRAPVPALWPPKAVAIGSDHGGVVLKDDLVRFLEAKKYTVVDCGTQGRKSVDYPDYAAAVAGRVRDGKCQAGIVIDTVGIGSSMAANKVAGVRCALCHDVATVLNSREHNDANVLSLGARVVPAALARRMVDLWLQTHFGGDRHLRRVEKIMELGS
jgi:ribose 5-phosphate isomerase B